MHRQSSSTTVAGCPRQPHCALKFGVGYGKGAEQEAALRAADYVTIWLGSHSRKHGNGFNPYWHGRMLDLVRERNVTAVYYAYIIAKLARRAIGAKDCDAAASGEPSLCVDGAEFVRRNEPLILRTYEQFANETAARAGRAARVVWLIEPDWYQYHAPTQRGGGLPQPAMVRLFSSILRKDGADYFLVTPVEKLGITVEDAPFVATDVTREGAGERQVLVFETHVGDRVEAGPDHPIRVEIDAQSQEPAPYVHVRGGLEARIDRKSFYRMVEWGEEAGQGGERWFGVRSGGMFFAMVRAEDLSGAG